MNVYDSFGQLIRENNEGLDKTFVYYYNNIGNITEVRTHSFTLSNTPGESYTSQHFTYSSTHPDRLTALGTKSISYNNLGYPTFYDGKNYEWTKGRLVRIYKGSESQPGSKFETCNFTYDSYGRRKRKYYNYDPNTSVSGDGHYYYITDYTYDESGRLINEFITEYRDTGTTTTHELVYLYDENGIIGVLYTYNGGTTQTYYYRRNLQGDVVAIYSATGARYAEYAYDAFGNCTLLYGASSTIAGVNPIRYRGYYCDRETGLYYLNARYYSPQWRRFISPDSTAYLDPETPNGLNLYAYCYNDPVNYADPSGHMAFWLAAGLIMAGIGLIGGAAYAGISSYNAGNRGWNLAGDIALGGLIGSAAGFAIGALFGAGTAALLAGNFMAETVAVFAGAGYALKMLSAGGITATFYMLCDNVNNSFHQYTHIFWSGGEAPMHSASYLSKYTNGISLNMTLLGKYLSLHPHFSDEVWIIASQNFANQVSVGGTVFSIQNIGGIGVDSIWALYEYPILIEKNVDILFEFIGGI